MRLLLAFALLAFSTICFGQSSSTAPDSVAFSVDQISDTLYTVKTDLFFIEEDGATSKFSAVTAPMDSAETAYFLRRSEVYGGKIGEIEIMGRIDVARAAQKFFAANARSASSDALSSLFSEHTGKDLDDEKVEFDNLFVGYWILVSRRSGNRVSVPIEIVRRRNGKLVVQVEDDITGEISRTTASINSRDEVVIRNLLDLNGRISLFRIKRDDRRFISVDGDFGMVPDRRRTNAAAKNKN